MKKRRHWTRWDHFAGYASLLIMMFAFCFAYLAIFVGMSWVLENLVKPNLGQSTPVQFLFLLASGATFIVPIVLGAAAAYACVLPISATMSGVEVKVVESPLTPALADWLDETG